VIRASEIGRTKCRQLESRTFAFATYSTHVLMIQTPRKRFNHLRKVGEISVAGETRQTQFEVAKRVIELTAPGSLLEPAFLNQDESTFVTNGRDSNSHRSFPRCEFQ